MSDKQTLLSEKPYRFVPILNIRPNDRIAALPHNDICSSGYSGTLKVEIEVISPLHIGSGFYVDTQDKQTTKLVRQFVRRNNKIVIPGSSIKGALKSIMEMVSRCCASVPKTSKATGSPDVKGSERALLPSSVTRKCTFDKMCAVCKIFGMIGSSKEKSYRGKVQIGEFSAIEDTLRVGIASMPALEAPFKKYPRNTNVYGNERLYYCQLCKGEQDWQSKCSSCSKLFWLEKKKSNKQLCGEFRGRKLYLLNSKVVTGKRAHEVVEKGTRFYGEINYSGMTKDELALLMFALGCASPDMRIRLGYGKPAYYGVIRAVSVTNCIPARPYLTGLENLNINEMARAYCNNEDKEITANCEMIMKLLSGESEGKIWQSSIY